MSGLYGTVEPNVIDDHMLKLAVEEQGPKDEAGYIAKREGIDFKDVTSLHLDFKNIQKIDNLWHFPILTKLQLDNNIIERIEGLDTLVNLTWLDLSFNNIEVISGLDALTKLEDLSLYNNRISVIENIGHLKNLQVLSLGNNNLSSLENLIYLRRFKALRSLSLNGNPLSEDEQYKMFIAAHLPDLVYLDFRLLDENIREIANVKFQYSIEELSQNEKLEQIKQDKEEEKRRELDSHKAAYVEFLNGPFFFESIYAEDVEGLKIASLPGVAELMDLYRTKCTAVCQAIFDYGIKHRGVRMAEEAIFNECLQEAVCENQTMGVKKIKEFEENNSEVLNELTQITDQQKIDDTIFQYNKDISQLSESLLALELLLVKQIEDITKDYERNITDMTSTFLETIQGFMTQIRDMENEHHEKLQEIGINLLERVIKGEMDEDMADDLRALFADKDTIMNALSSSHEIHLLKIDNREDDIVTKINNWSTSLSTKVHKDELLRNRKRVAEINKFMDHLHDELDNLEIHDQI
ncbi:dynein regulatory complex subunit 3 [Pelobates fuscus]|uniref:dynein regulatory complex subunit 3 n=1 Tax=Pelobates fuscus TaxID=191477 RepID=UPI002FE4DD2B